MKQSIIYPLPRPDYETLVDFENFDIEKDWLKYLTFLTMMATPSRVNVIPDFFALCLAFYFNYWYDVMWFGLAFPINVGFEIYYIILPLADMPPLSFEPVDYENNANQALWE